MRQKTLFHRARLDKKKCQKMNKEYLVVLARLLTKRFSVCVFRDTAGQIFAEATTKHEGMYFCVKASST